jgi:cyclin-dependent kinase regulatory subunit CKS1
MPANTIYYSDKYYDETFEYRCVASRPNPQHTCVVLNQSVRDRCAIDLARTHTPRRPTRSRRHVILPQDIAKNLPKNLLSEREWRALGVQQSRGWVHYGQHKPEPHILLMRRPMSSLPDHLIPK